MLISEEYRELQRKFHGERADYGIAAAGHVSLVAQAIVNQEIRSVLDYGCGKRKMEEGLRGIFNEGDLEITSYDPAIPGLENPKPAELVLCLDVMEHVEEECVEAVLKHIYDLSLKYVLFSIALTPAKKVMPDGRNAHITLLSPRVWVAKLNRLFDFSSLLISDKTLTLFATK